MTLTGTLPATRTETRCWEYDPLARLLRIVCTTATRTTADEYLVREVGPSDFDVVKQGEVLPEGVEPTTYAVVLGKGCSCPAGNYRGACRHYSALAAIQKELTPVCSRRGA